MNAASKKILIADDDSSIRLVLSQAFTRLGYQVRATGNATSNSFKHVVFTNKTAFGR